MYFLVKLAKTTQGLRYLSVCELKFTELLGQTGVDRVKSSHGFQQIFSPVFDLHCALRLQNSTSGQQETHTGSCDPGQRLH